MVNNWALAIGINQYEFSSVRPLRFAEQNALAMRQFLCDKAEFPAGQVLVPKCLLNRVQ
jgi:uncharacterized caspase-like protein